MTGHEENRVCRHCRCRARGEREGEPYLIKVLINGSDPGASLGTICGRDDFLPLVEKHGLALFSGPMLGCVTDSGARFWIRSAFEADVQVIVGAGKELSNPVRSETVKTAKADDLTAVVEGRGSNPSASTAAMSSSAGRAS